MPKKYLKILGVSFLVALFFAPLVQVKADGGMIPHYTSSGEDIYEPSQSGLLVYRDGQEDLYIQAKYEGSANEFAWIIPTPGYPGVTKAPEGIFRALSALTTNEPLLAEEKQRQESNFDKAMTGSVTVHSRKQVGMYDTAVLSASGSDALYDWLKENNYPVEGDIKDTLDWYIEKNWYFTAMRIDPGKVVDSVARKLERELGKDIVNGSFSEEDRKRFAEELSEFFINSILEKSFERFKTSAGFLSDLGVVGMEDFEDVKNLTESEFDEDISSADPVIYEVEEEKGQIKEDILDRIDELESVEIEEGGNNLAPIRISFRSGSMVYPLKISSISTKVPEGSSESKKTNEVLLYVLNDEQVTAPGFDLEFSREIDADTLKGVIPKMWSSEASRAGMKGLVDIVGEESLSLTKMRRTFAKEEMDEDVYVVEGSEYSPAGSSEMAPLAESYREKEMYKQVRDKVMSSSADVSVEIGTTLRSSMQGQKVKRLQKLLNKDPDTRVAESGVGSPGNETEYFGSLTRQAVRRFQKKYGVVSSGDESTTGYGLVGPQTRKTIKKVFSGRSSAVSDSGDDGAESLQERIQELLKQVEMLRKRLGQKQ